MDFSTVDFMLSVHSLKQLPEEEMPEIAFAGRSNVGKSSLMNVLIQRKSMVKTSSRPGKTQGLNFFQVGDVFRLVDLPGYGYAKVAKGMQNAWQTLITAYLEKRQRLACVVVIVDIRHEAKEQDTLLIDWLRDRRIPFLVVYTKIDKIGGSVLQKHASRLDKGHHLRPEEKRERILFSAHTGRGREDLVAALEGKMDFFSHCTYGASS